MKYETWGKWGLKDNEELWSFLWKIGELMREMLKNRTPTLASGQQSVCNGEHNGPVLSLARHTAVRTRGGVGGHSGCAGVGAAPVELPYGPPEAQGRIVCSASGLRVWGVFVCFLSYVTPGGQVCRRAGTVLAVLRRKSILVAGTEHQA